MKWLSDCCDAQPVGDVYEWVDIKSDEKRASGYCADCKEPCDFHEDGK